MQITTKSLNTFLLTAACCAAFSVTTVRAQDDGQQGGDIDGNETLDLELMMTPTSAAPAGSSIELSLEAEDENGATDAKLKLETRNLTPGTYSVSVTLKSDGSTVTLGSFTVDAEGEGEIEFGDDGMPFPANFNPMDIATVTVTDSNNVVIFTADLTNLSGMMNQDISANVQATAGLSDPNATGNAMLTAFVSRGRAKGSLQFIGHGLPMNLPIVIAVNGIAAKNLKTDKTGSFNVKLGPKGKNNTIVSGVSLANVTSVTILDNFGNVLLQANF
jgi:hypothetical protein